MLAILPSSCASRVLIRQSWAASAEHCHARDGLALARPHGHGRGELRRTITRPSSTRALPPRTYGDLPHTGVGPVGGTICGGTSRDGASIQAISANSPLTSWPRSRQMQLSKRYLAHRLGQLITASCFAAISAIATPAAAASHAS